MKHINESIIGRKGTYSSTKLWLLYPLGDDYTTASKRLPDDCKIYFDYIDKRSKFYNETLILFCVNRQQLKEFFDGLSSDNMFTNPRFTNPESALFEINPRYLKNFEDVEKWLDQIPSESFDSIHTANELKEVNIPKYIKSL